MKKLLLLCAMVLASITLVVTPIEADAKRLGGGRPAGMQRQMPARSPDAAPQRPVQPNQAPAPGAAPTAPAQPGARSWLGPVAGIAAGLGIAALMSHLGMGEAFGNIVTMALLVLGGLVILTWVMRRLKGAEAAPAARMATAGASYEPYQPAPRQPSVLREAQADAFAPHESAPVSGGAMPARFDEAGFTRIAKMIFIRLQAANDAGNVDDLRKFTTPELFASLRLDLQERGQAPNQTDVLQLDAELVETAQEHDQWVATVRFHGLIREESDQGAQPFNELWHLVRPLDESRDWAIAGITPLQA